MTTPSMSASSYRGTQSEADFQKGLIKRIQLRGYRVYSIPDSRRATDKGFPDLTILGHGLLSFVELKTAKGVVGEEQIAWKRELDRVREIDARIVRPSTVAELERLLEDYAEQGRRG